MIEILVGRKKPENITKIKRKICCAWLLQCYTQPFVPIVGMVDFYRFSFPADFLLKIRCAFIRM